MHIKHLKMTSAFVAELRGGQQFRGWDADRYLRVAEVDTLRGLSHMYLVAHIDPKKHKPKPPDAWEIPDVRPKTNSPGSFASMALRHLNAEKKFKN